MVYTGVLSTHWKYQRGEHDIEHEITYEGSNFIFHDSQGFESGAKEEIELVWDFIEKQSAATKLKDQLHAIWYHGIATLKRPKVHVQAEEACTAPLGSRRSARSLGSRSLKSR